MLYYFRLLSQSLPSKLALFIERSSGMGTRSLRKGDALERFKAFMEFLIRIKILSALRRSFSGRDRRNFMTDIRRGFEKLHTMSCLLEFRLAVSRSRKNSDFFLAATDVAEEERKFLMRL